VVEIDDDSGILIGISLTKNIKIITAMAPGIREKIALLHK